LRKKTPRADQAAAQREEHASEGEARRHRIGVDLFEQGDVIWRAGQEGELDNVAAASLCEHVVADGDPRRPLHRDRCPLRLIGVLEVELGEGVLRCRSGLSGTRRSGGWVEADLEGVAVRRTLAALLRDVDNDHG